MNADPKEIGKFNELAGRWWDPEGDFKPLHRMNPLRVGYIEERVGLAGKRCLDIGCGGGILTEGLARLADSVTGIDLADGPLQVAELHLHESGLNNVSYRKAAAEDLVAEEAQQFDIVTCLEVLEHVPDPAQLVAACSKLVRPGGDIVFSTINRNPKAFALAIVGAEYLLRLLPKGTHTFEKFIQPAELDNWGRQAGLRLLDLTGLHYDPFRERFSIGGNVDVNYLAHFRC